MMKIRRIQTMFKFLLGVLIGCVMNELINARDEDE